ncbi:MAG: hypothetical protein U0797_05775 [Gemmataceae bacterium]
MGDANRRAAVLILGAVLFPGCEPRPRAPALTNDPVFVSEQEGFRFLAPDDWSQGVRGDIPPGKADKERPLVEFSRMSGGPPASLRVSLADLPPSTDLAAYLAGPSFSAERWAPTEAAVDAPVGSASGVRYAFKARVGKGEMVKEVVAVRRGERVYFFTALYTPKDTEVREQLRRVVGSVVWKK